MSTTSHRSDPSGHTVFRKAMPSPNTISCFGDDQTFHDVWDAPRSSQPPAHPNRRSRLQRVQTLMVIVLLACNSMLLYMSFRTHQRQTVIDSQIEKIDKAIESNDSGRLFVFPHAARQDARQDGGTEFFPTAAESARLPRPTHSDPPQSPVHPASPPTAHVPYQRRYVTEMQTHCKPCRNSTLRTSSTDD